jgi:hypothetical protein
MKMIVKIIDCGATGLRMPNGMIAHPQGYPGGAVTSGVGMSRAAPLARKGHERLGVTARALKPCEASGPHRAVEECAELLFEEHRQPPGIGAGGGREERLEVLADDLVEDGACRVAGRIPRGRNGLRTVFAGRGLVSYDEVMTVVDGGGIAASR